MTALSVNVNKIALLRNARGRDFPNVLRFVGRLLELGVAGITVHPRPDGRHITRDDALAIGRYLRSRPEVEYNIEGYPSAAFLELALRAEPDQCTLVPDAPEQLTSDHGWDAARHRDLLAGALERLRAAGARGSLFVDPEPAAAAAAAAAGAERVELYTEEYARSFGTASQARALERYARTAAAAAAAGAGVNAGHDLDLRNLGPFLEAVPDVLEVSIGHALVVEAIELGIGEVVRRYLAIAAGG